MHPAHLAGWADHAVTGSTHDYKYMPCGRTWVQIQMAMQWQVGCGYECMQDTRAGNSSQHCVCIGCCMTSSATFMGRTTSTRGTSMGRTGTLRSTAGICCRCSLLTPVWCIVAALQVQVALVQGQCRAMHPAEQCSQRAGQAAGARHGRGGCQLGLCCCCCAGAVLGLCWACTGPVECL